MKKIELENKVVLITGVAGFIGANLACKLLNSVEQIRIVGIDNMNDYYDISIKEYRLQQIRITEKSVRGTFEFVKADISCKEVIQVLFSIFRPDIVVNLAAQAGVRYSVVNPDVYIKSNLEGFYNILEACRHSYDNNTKGVEHLVYASSSSVYGGCRDVPYSVDEKVDNPVSLYAATKKSNEILAYAYSQLYNIPSTGL